MPSIPVFGPSSSSTREPGPNPLPGLLRTPSGLAMIELQGTLHFPAPAEEEEDVDTHDQQQRQQQQPGKKRARLDDDGDDEDGAVAAPVTIGAAEAEDDSAASSSSSSSMCTSSRSTRVGKLVFPLHDPEGPAGDDVEGDWMRRVYLYVGDHQRMTGEVRKLPKPVAVMRRRRRRRRVPPDRDDGQVGMEEEEEEQLEVVEIVRYKVVFANRPEPVSTSDGHG